LNEPLFPAQVLPVPFSISINMVSASILPEHPDDVIAFWLEAGPKKWFAHDAAFDAEIRARFEDLHLSAARGEHLDWAQTQSGALALLLLLDQFPRNLWRGSAHAFATDPLARSIADAALTRGLDQQAELQLRVFFYLPFEHSERPEDQERAVALCRAAYGADDRDGYLRFAILHQDIIARFGRFPHRNAALGRASTPQEQAFLDDGGFKG
jgi:uncharacterized protein (DUF924 family)